MPKRIPLSTIVVYRDGKRVVPEIGKPFDFTPEEAADVNALEKKLKDQGNPQLLFRKVINEDPETLAAANTAEQNRSGSAPAEGADYDSMTVPQLKELAEAREIDLGDATKKVDIIAKLKGATAGEGDEDL
ncbi:TPA: hypothetical protein L4T14_001433 [Pseudomonas aeruginosa]|nr:hypothetical protein [Pseudomonas aeruginosa]